MSFIDLMADHVWSEADITNRTEAMVRSEFPAAAEAILNRKLQGTAMGYVLTADEQAEVMRFQAAVMGAREAGALARADMALLAATMALETAQRRLALPVLEPMLQEAVDEAGTVTEMVTNQEALDLDASERAQAQAAVDGASPEALALADTRALARSPLLRAQRRLEQPVVEPAMGVDEQGEPIVLNQAEVDTDTKERAEAQSVVDAETPTVEPENPEVEEEVVQ